MSRQVLRHIKRTGTRRGKQPDAGWNKLAFTLDIRDTVRFRGFRTPDEPGKCQNGQDIRRNEQINARNFFQIRNAVADDAEALRKSAHRGVLRPLRCAQAFSLAYYELCSSDGFGIKTARGLLPSYGPTIPLASIASISRAALV